MMKELLKRPGEYLYNYDYQPYESWLCAYGGADNADVDKDALKRAFDERTDCFIKRDDVQREIRRTAESINRLRTKSDTGQGAGAPGLVFTLLADSHYVINGNWEETAATMEAVHALAPVDGVIHLGDLTDGMLGKDTCRDYSGRIMDRIRSWDKPFYITIGNHDANYFRGNPDLLSEAEQYEFYLKGIMENMPGSSDNDADFFVSDPPSADRLWYAIDYSGHKLRMLFLHSYDNAEPLRYGFPDDEIKWVRAQLESLPNDYCVIIFSHEAPLARLDYWASKIRGGDKLMEMLEGWHTHVLAFIHGHTHCDYIYDRGSFPIISVGCSKIEYFPDKKPDGAIRQVREDGTVTQELWNTMIINTTEGRIDLVRFGAGCDRSVRINKAVINNNGKPQIWGHRGASGHAPENTLEAFKLAADMKADGVELDVQFTRDRQLVVIHDETIDRTSNGSGYVANYTREELRAFNFNRTHPEYEHADIPTLKEVLDLLYPTGMTVNIELKTGVNLYPGIEEEVVRTVRECGMEERVIYSSFNHASVLKIRDFDPDARLGFLYCDGTYDLPSYAKEHGAYALHPTVYNMKYPGFAEECKDKDIKIHVWTVNDPGIMDEMAQYGVDSIITNYPDIARETYFGGKINTEELIEKIKAEAAGNEIVASEASDRPNTQLRHKNPVFHAIGVTYGAVRKVFIAIDKRILRLSGR